MLGVVFVCLVVILLSRQLLLYNEFIDLIQNSDYQKANELIENNSSIINGCSVILESPEDLFVRKGDSNSLNYMLKLRGSENVYETQSYLLIEAIKANDSEVLVTLLKNGANPNYRPSKGKRLTPLHFTVGHRRIKLLKILMEYGADPTISDGQGESALELAKANKWKDALLEFSKNKTNKTKRHPQG